MGIPILRSFFIAFHLFRSVIYNYLHVTVRSIELDMCHLLHIYLTKELVQYNYANKECHCRIADQIIC